MKTVKFAVFTDLHHDLMPDAPIRLRQFLEKAHIEHVDFIVQLGDFCRPTLENQALIDCFNSFDKPHYHVLGNHDMDIHNKKDAIKALGMPANYYAFTECGFLFLSCDANYLRNCDSGVCEDYSYGNFLTSTDELPFLPQNELKWIEEQINTTDMPVVLLSHQSFENDIDGVINRSELQAIINRANDNNKRVLLCINGHNHTDFLRVIGKTCYLDLNSISNQWLGESYEHYDYPKNEYEKRPNLNKIVTYKDPIFAVVTIKEDGTIDIAGEKSCFYKSSPKSLGHSGISSGRMCKPEVSSASLNCWIR